MKRSICIVTLALFSCSTLVLGAGDPCTDKYNECVNHCANLLAQCKLRGRDLTICAKDHDICKQNCETAKTNCAGGNPKQTTPPKKTDPKKPAAKKTNSTQATPAPKK